MRVFGIGVIIAIAVAVGAAIGLNFIQKTVAKEYSTGAARLDQQENVNNYGR
jgi:hypothetical protein